ncbi:Mpo1 family 2-hydroxy fatty acid dioxygenase [Thalassotalea ganghwensis]
MKSLKEQLSTYKSVHLNINNIKTHFIGIPLIIWSIAVLLAGVSFEFSLLNATVNLSLATCVASIIFLYYLILSLPLALIALALFGALIYSAVLFSQYNFPWYVAIIVFIIGWVFQFIGHGYEKAKPAFVDDINQLSIGPLFLIAEIYFALGLNKSLAADVHAMAIEKRRDFEQLKSTTS